MLQRNRDAKLHRAAFWALKLAQAAAPVQPRENVTAKLNAWIARYEAARNAC